MLQAAGYVALCVCLLLPFGWQTGVLYPLQTDAPLLGFALIAASVLAGLSASGFLMLLRASWLLAMALQGATLLGCLALCFPSLLARGRVAGRTVAAAVSRFLPPVAYYYLRVLNPARVAT